MSGPLLIVFLREHVPSFLIFSGVTHESWQYYPLLLDYFINSWRGSFLSPHTLSDCFIRYTCRKGRSVSYKRCRNKWTTIVSSQWLEVSVYCTLGRHDDVGVHQWDALSLWYTCIRRRFDFFNSSLSPSSLLGWKTVHKPASSSPGQQTSTKGQCLEVGVLKMIQCP